MSAIPFGPSSYPVLGSRQRDPYFPAPRYNRVDSILGGAPISPMSGAAAPSFGSSDETYDQHMARRRMQRFGYDPQASAPTYANPATPANPAPAQTPSAASATRVVRNPPTTMPNPAWVNGGPATQPTVADPLDATKTIVNPHYGRVSPILTIPGGQSVVSIAPTTQPAPQFNASPGASPVASPGAAPQFYPGAQSGVAHNVNGIPSDAGNYERNRAYSDTHHGVPISQGVQLTTQQARQMWHNYLGQNAPHLLGANGAVSDKTMNSPEYEQHVGAFSNYLQQKYGVDPSHTDAMFRQWQDEGTSGQGDFVRGQIATPAAPYRVFAGGSGGRSGLYQLPSGDRVVVDANGAQVGPAVGHTAPLAPVMQNEYGPERGYTPINGPVPMLAGTRPPTAPATERPTVVQGARPTQTAQAKPAAKPNYTDEDVNFTAQKYGITPDEVRRRLGV